jgi:hypothetical protein
MGTEPMWSLIRGRLLPDYAFEIWAHSVYNGRFPTKKVAKQRSEHSRAELDTLYQSTFCLNRVLL